MAYEIDLDPKRVDLEVAWRFLSTEAYWRRDRVRADFDTQVAQAWRLAGAYAGGEMVGFAKAVRAGEGIAWLDDVFVLGPHRGRGAGQALVGAMLDAGPGLTWRLRTMDAHALYAKFGFAPVDELLMERPVMDGGPAA